MPFRPSVFETRMLEDEHLICDWVYYARFKRAAHHIAKVDVRTLIDKIRL